MKATVASLLLAALAQGSPVPNTSHTKVCTFDQAPVTTGDLAAESSLSKRQSTWSPPSNLVTPLQQVWDHEMSTYNNPLGFKNFGYDQIMANKGYLNFCVRWESSTPVTEAQRAQVEVALQRSQKKWIDKLVGFDGFPYASVPVKVVGWAVKDASLLQGSTSGIDVTVNNIREGAPECNAACGRFFHQDGNYASCPGGAARHYGKLFVLLLFSSSIVLYFLPMREYRSLGEVLLTQY